jgi:hypothetical protein
MGVICFFISLPLSPTNVAAVADVFRYATSALLAGAITALLYERRGAHDSNLVAKNVANQIIAQVTELHRSYIPRGF